MTDNARVRADGGDVDISGVARAEDVMPDISWAAVADPVPRECPSWAPPDLVRAKHLQHRPRVEGRVLLFARGNRVERAVEHEGRVRLDESP